MATRLAGSAIALLLMVTTAWAGAVDRCRGYAQETRRAHFAAFGLDYPWWYAVGQLQAESGCRDVLSRDGVGSEGPAQITYRWWRPALDRADISEIRTTRNHLRAQAFINHDAWRQASKAEAARLWVAFQIYNGGGLVLREIGIAGVCDWQAAKDQCRRKIVVYADGSRESACSINYDYSRKVYRYGQFFRLGGDGDRFRFW